MGPGVSRPFLLCLALLLAAFATPSALAGARVKAGAASYQPTGGQPIKADGASFRKFAAGRGLQVKRARRVKGAPEFVMVEEVSGRVSLFRRQDTRNLFAEVPMPSLHGLSLGDGTGRGLSAVTKSGNLRVYSEKANGTVDNEILILSSRALPRRRLVDPATKPVPTEHSTREAAYFEYTRNGDSLGGAAGNWDRGKQSEIKRAAESRTRKRTLTIAAATAGRTMIATPLSAPSRVNRNPTPVTFEMALRAVRWTGGSAN